MPLVLHAVVPSDGATAPAADLELVSFRHLAAVVRPVPGRGRDVEVGEPDAEEHRAVVEALFKERTVLPAPAGVVARGRDCVAQWLELHYVTLTEAMEFVDGRCAARVHVTPALPPASDHRPLDAPPIDLDGVAGEAFRALRRHAAASITLRHPAKETHRVSAAFLVETDRWRAFADAVAEEGRRDAIVRVELSGPWPPYDFVKMQFGG